MNPKKNISKTREMNMNDGNANKLGRKVNAEEENVVENDKKESIEEGNLRSDCFPKENAREKTLEKNVKENISKHRDAKENSREKLLT